MRATFQMMKRMRDMLHRVSSASAADLLRPCLTQLQLNSHRLPHTALFLLPRDLPQPLRQTMRREMMFLRAG